MICDKITTFTLPLPPSLLPQSETALHVAVRKASLDVTDILRKAPGGESLEQIKNKVVSQLVAYTC